MKRKAEVEQTAFTIHNSVVIRSDRQYRWFLIRGKPLRDGPGNIIRWFSSGTEIEEQKRVLGNLSNWSMPCRST
jgi:hypothetical protein